MIYGNQLINFYLPNTIVSIGGSAFYNNWRAWFNFETEGTEGFEQFFAGLDECDESAFFYCSDYFGYLIDQGIVTSHPVGTAGYVDYTDLNGRDWTLLIWVD